MQFELGITKNGLKEIKNRMAQTAPTHSSPKEFLRQNSDMVDGLVRKAFQKAQSKFPLHRSVSWPWEDMEGLNWPLTRMSISSSFTPRHKRKHFLLLIEKILYPLWDLGLDVSCSSRSITECLKMAQSDLHVKTGLIDGRYLDGEYEFFRNLYSLFTKKVLHQKVREFAEVFGQGSSSPSPEI